MKKANKTKKTNNESSKEPKNIQPNESGLISAESEQSKDLQNVNTSESSETLPTTENVSESEDAAENSEKDNQAESDKNDEAEQPQKAEKIIETTEAVLGTLVFQSTKDLLNELGNLKSIAKKSAISVLEFVLIETNGKGVYITGTDIETTLRIFVPCEIKSESPFRFCAHITKLFECIKRSKEPLTITVNSVKRTEKADDSAFDVTTETITLNFLSGGMQFKMNEDECLSSENFPSVAYNSAVQIEEVESVTPSFYQIAAELLQDLMRKTAFAVTNEQSRFTLSGIKFEQGKKDSGLRLVATDGQRLSIAETMNFKETKKLDGRIISITAIKLLQRFALLGTVTMKNYKEHTVFEFGRKTIVTRKISGTFPNYKMVIPQDHPFMCSFDAAEMSRVMDAVLPFANPRNCDAEIQAHNNQIYTRIIGDALEDIIFSTSMNCYFPHNNAPFLRYNARFMKDICESVKNNARLLICEFKNTNGVMLLSGDNGKIAYQFVMMACKAEYASAYKGSGIDVEKYQFVTDETTVAYTSFEKETIVSDAPESLSFELSEDALNKVLIAANEIKAQLKGLPEGVVSKITNSLLVICEEMEACQY